MSEMLAEKSRPEAGLCWGYQIKIHYPPGFTYRGIAREYGWYFGSCCHDRLIERIDEQLNPEVILENRAYTIRRGKECKQSDWLFTAVHKFDATLTLERAVLLPTCDLEEAGVIWDENMSKAYELMGELAYGK